MYHNLHRPAIELQKETGLQLSLCFTLLALYGVNACLNIPEEGEKQYEDRRN